MFKQNTLLIHTHTHIHTHKHKQREPLQRLARIQRLKVCPLCQCHHTALFCQFASLRAERAVSHLPSFFAPVFNAWMDEFSCLDQHGLSRLTLYIYIFICVNVHAGEILEWAGNRRGEKEKWWKTESHSRDLKSSFKYNLVACMQKTYVRFLWLFKMLISI